MRKGERERERESERQERDRSCGIDMFNRDGNRSALCNVSHANTRSASARGRERGRSSACGSRRRGWVVGSRVGGGGGGALQLLRVGSLARGKTTHTGRSTHSIRPASVGYRVPRRSDFGWCCSDGWRSRVAGRTSEARLTRTWHTEPESP